MLRKQDNSLKIMDTIIMYNLNNLKNLRGLFNINLISFDLNHYNLEIFECKKMHLHANQNFYNAIK